MIAKGLDFPNVRLVGVLNADLAMTTPDFRAAERTFNLICQVAGRSGRDRQQGTVVVQTFGPDEPAIAYAAKHDYAGFISKGFMFSRIDCCSAVKISRSGPAGN